MKLILQKPWQISWYWYSISDHLQIDPICLEQVWYVISITFRTKKVAGHFSFRAFLGPKSTLELWGFLTCCQNFFKNSIFNKISYDFHGCKKSDFGPTCQKSARFNGRFRTKECSKRKVFGNLFGPKCDGEYISDLFETFGVDMEWSEMLHQCQ